MIHYTLNTDHSRESPRSEVDDGVIAAITPLLTGDHSLPNPPGYALTTSTVGGGLLATVWSGDRPCVTLGVAPDDDAADELWPALESLYYEITDSPGWRSVDFSAAHQPAAAPWCAALTIAATPHEAYWMADFERCMAWAWIAAHPTAGE